jgi:hypothetical protein
MLQLAYMQWGESEQTPEIGKYRDHAPTIPVAECGGRQLYLVEMRE